MTFWWSMVALGIGVGAGTYLGFLLATYFVSAGIERWENNLSHEAGLELARSPIDGMGVFATRSYALGDIVGIYYGFVSLERGTPSFMIVDDTEDGTAWGVEGTGILRFCNSSQTPNTYMDGIVLYASAPIEVGDEITFDYEFEDAEMS